MKKYIVILLIIIIACGVYINFNYKNNTNNRETSITLIPDTSGYVYNEDAYVEYCIIDNPPDDLMKLKELIKKYNDDNTIVEETEDGRKPSKYRREFLEVTKYTQKDWRPKWHSDIIDDHLNDVIAKVSWKKGDTEKLYVIWKKESDSFWNRKSNRETIEQLTVKE
ncbi:hypothetical protein CLOBY_08360 [Clostridium saccharobutylicum]|uniref:hypothetical protein n=1 Tax=Clostridium saccharobutylicum TaxID=169679 RepID=UPI0009838D47|nr:hypothetical protein [Clostridium saccharobutylicum]AQS08726.1 hypothetical protein CLOBY_08360 [Clostridium saccharobutylicum]MBC2438846.1 hypothetical protein [Clostridium saccharobutylicum]NSB91122.1 alpha/beta superfamily hydrolase [Clostridium saccharobutylicum]NYC28929.1 hypothetical protein [Clostridium saccharobutylicum]OOM18989.1 hypothetical protein CLSAB_01860 [Clostridium saccharobutylicum]